MNRPLQKNTQRMTMRHWGVQRDLAVFCTFGMRGGSRSAFRAYATVPCPQSLGV